MCIKGHYQESEKTFYRMGENVNKHVSSKSLISRIYKKYLQFDNKKTTPFYKWQRTSIDISLKKIYQWPTNT